MQQPLLGSPRHTLDDAQPTIAGARINVIRAINLLLAEDSEDDATLVIRELRRGGFEVWHERVESAAAMAAALQRQAWDVVISDYNMAGFSGLDALEILRSTGPDIPFILISGAVGEEMAVQALKAGANDFISKSNLSRLASVLDRELQAAASRGEHRRAEIELRTLSLAVRQSGTGIVITDPVGAIEFANPKFEAMTGYSASEIKGKNPRFLKSGETPLETYRNLWETITAGKEWCGEIQNRKKSGEIYWEQQHISPVFDDDGRIAHFIAVKDDVTERKRAERELQQFRMAMDVSADSIYLTDAASMSFIYINDTACRRLGYSRKQLLQLGPPDVLHMDREAIRREYDKVIAAGDRGLVHERQFVRSDGSEGTSELHRRALRTDGGTLIVTIGRDITERRQADERIRRLNRMHAVLSGINSAIVRISDRTQLLQEACRIAVDAGRFALAYVCVVDAKEQRLSPIASAGADIDFLEEVQNRLSLRDDAREGHGAAARAVREKRAVVVNDVANDPQLRHRTQHTDRGIRSIAILPLIVADESVGMLGLHSTEADFFDEQEMKLLHELAGDIAFALDHIEKADKLVYLAYYDPLTGLANRALFLERLNQHVHVAGPAESKIAVVLADIERLTTINESLGRQAGDAVIKEFAARLADAFDPAAVARISTDQIAIILQAVKGKSEVTRRVEGIWRECLSRPINVEGTRLRIVAKAGITLYPNDAADSETLLRNAEAALRKAKQLGERYMFYTSALTERTAEKLTLENQLRQALEKEEFVLHYQPKVDAETGRIVGVEALIRWQSLELGLVPPMKFIPLMEQTGLILAVGTWGLRRASRDHRRWVEQGLAAPRIAVNVSPIQLRQRDFVGAVERAIMEGVSPTCIDLEITESLVMEDIESNIEKLKSVRGLGVGIAIDDFGTGYSSLGYLAKLPVQSLKIDRSFIITMLDDAATMTLVRTIISLAHSLRLKVVAEGVDSEDQARILRLLRCDEMQGYLFSKPLPFDEITALLNSGNKI